MTVGVSALCYCWADLTEAFARGVDGFGLELIEFTTTQLDGEQYAELGLLSQRFGASVGLRAPLGALRGSCDLRRTVAGFGATPSEWIAALEALRERSEEALASYALLELDQPSETHEGLGPLAVALAATLPAYEAAGIPVYLAGGEPEALSWIVQRLSPGALGLCLDTREARAYDPLAFPGSRPGYVRVSTDPGEDSAAASLLQAVAAIGFGGPFLLAFPDGCGGERFREVAAWLRGLV